MSEFLVGGPYMDMIDNAQKNMKSVKVVSHYTSFKALKNITQTSHI